MDGNEDGGIEWAKASSILPVVVMQETVHMKQIHVIAFVMVVVLEA